MQNTPKSGIRRRQIEMFVFNSCEGLRFFLFREAKEPRKKSLEPFFRGIADIRYICRFNQSIRYESASFPIIYVLPLPRVAVWSAH